MTRGLGHNRKEERVGPVLEHIGAREGHNCLGSWGQNPPHFSVTELLNGGDEAPRSPFTVILVSYPVHLFALHARIQGTPLLRRFFPAAPIARQAVRFLADLEAL